MFDYNIEDAQRILKSFDYTNLRLENHVLDNWFERDVNFNYIYDCLSSKMLLTFPKQPKIVLNSFINMKRLKQKIFTL